MKTAQEWQDELNGETSVKSIREIQIDALSTAVKLLIEKGRFDGYNAVVDLLDSLWA